MSVRVVRSLEFIRRISIAIAMLLLLTGSAHAASITITWNANTEADIAGYIVLYGTASGVYSTNANVGNVTSYVATGLATGVRYFVAVRAYNTAGLISAASAETSTTLAPAVARVTVTPTTKNLKVGETAAFSAQAFDAADNPLPSVALT